MLVAEAQKKLKQIKEQKQELLQFEREHSTTSYILNETPMDNSSYEFKSTDLDLQQLNTEELLLKGKLNKHNTNVVIAGGLTTGELLVMAAQIKENITRLEKLNSNPELRRSSPSFHNKEVEFTKVNYDKQQVAEELKSQKDVLQKIYLDIDKANLTHEI